MDPRKDWEVLTGSEKKLAAFNWIREKTRPSSTSSSSLISSVSLVSSSKARTPRWSVHVTLVLTMQENHSVDAYWARSVFGDEFTFLLSVLQCKEMIPFLQSCLRRTTWVSMTNLCIRFLFLWSLWYGRKDFEGYEDWQSLAWYLRIQVLFDIRLDDSAFPFFAGCN